MKTIRTSIVRFALCASMCGVAVAQESVDSLMRRDSIRYGWTHRPYSSDELRLHPSRNLDQLLLLSPGVVSSSSPTVWQGFYTSGRGQLPVEYTLHFRGSRSGMTDYRLNGISILDRFSNSSGLVFIPEAFEEMTVHTGAYSALYGAASGGLVDLRLRRGGDTWTVSAQHLTDDFAATGSPFLDTYSYGQHTSTVTFGGPLLFDSRLFVAAEIHRMRDRTPRWIEPMSYELRTDPYSNPADMPLPQPFELKNNHVPLSSMEQSGLYWNLTVPVLGPDIEFWGMIGTTRTRDAETYAMVRNFYRQQRVPWWDENRTLIGLTVAEEALPGLRVQATIVRDLSWAHTTDPDFGEDWRSYSDSAANAVKGYGGFTGRYYSSGGFNTVERLTAEMSTSANRLYHKRSVGSWRVQTSANLEITPSWSVTLLGESEWWTLRKFDLGNAAFYRSFLDTDNDGVDDRTFVDAADRENQLRRYGYVGGFGFDTNGGPLDDTRFGARHPSILSLSLSGTWHEGSFHLEGGARGTWSRTDVPTLKRASTEDGLYDAIPFDFANSMVDPSALEPATRTSHLLPRFSVLHAEGGVEAYFSWGKFLNALSWDELHRDLSEYSNQISPNRSAPFYATYPVLTSSARPEVTIHAEAGFRWKVNQVVRLEASVFSKTMPGQVQLGTVLIDRQETQPTGFVNSGDGKALGYEGNAVLTSGSGVTLHLGYGYLNARGYSSYPRDNFLDVAQPSTPTIQAVSPFVYEISHRLTGDLVLVADEDSWWHGLSGMMSGRFDAGHPFTKVEQGGYSSLAPWFAAMRSVYSPSSTYIEEPKNVSRTPWTFTLDVSASYWCEVGPVNVRGFVAVTNVLNTKNTVNLYPTTRSATDDGWLTSEYATGYLQNLSGTNYESMYRALNLKNRYAYLSISGKDIYAAPRQLRLGVEVGL